MNIDTSIVKDNTCHVDSATTHTNDKKYFSYLVKREINVNTISGASKIIEGSVGANVLFSSLNFL
jgi:hypothetical protein